MACGKVFGCLLITVVFVCISAESQPVKIAVTSVNCAVDDCIDCGSSILINGREYSRKRDGINMVVFDTRERIVTFSTSFGVSDTKKLMSTINELSSTSLVLLSSQVLCESGSSVDARTQSFILEMVGRLLGRTLQMQSYQLRSLVYIFCAEPLCIENKTSTISLPFFKARKLNDDPLLVFFKLFQSDNRRTTTFESKSDPKPDKRDQTILYASIGTCATVTLVVIISVLLLYRCKRRENLQQQRRQSNINEQSECELLSCSPRPESHVRNSEAGPATSFRMFSQFIAPSDRDSLTPQSFAAYIEVGRKDCGPVIYKVPSGIKRHDPPTSPPPYSPNHIEEDNPLDNPIEPRASSEYLAPHVYTKPNDEDTCYDYALTNQTSPLTTGDSGYTSVTANDDSGYHNMREGAKSEKENVTETDPEYIDPAIGWSS